MYLYLVKGTQQHIVRGGLDPLGPPWSLWCSKDLHGRREDLRAAPAPEVEVCVLCSRTMAAYYTSLDVRNPLAKK